MTLLLHERLHDDILPFYVRGEKVIDHDKPDDKGGEKMGLDEIPNGQSGQGLTSLTTAGLIGKLATSRLGTKLRNLPPSTTTRSRPLFPGENHAVLRVGPKSTANANFCGQFLGCC